MSVRGPRSRFRWKDSRAAALFLLPNLVGFLAFVAFPVAFSLWMSFTNWTLHPGKATEWVGLRNYAEMFRDSNFWYYAYNTFYLMLGLPFSIAGSLLLANLLSLRIRGRVAFRTLFYLPQFTAGVALIILWRALYNKDFGFINAMLGRVCSLLGLHEAVLPDWLGSTSHLLGWLPLPAFVEGRHLGLGARDALLFMGVWIIIGGTNMLLYLAGISNIPDTLYEAAEIDGAGWWAKFRHVTWPQLAPTTFFIVVMSVIGGLQGGFEEARVMTQGGPAGCTTTLSYYIYTKGFQELEFGYACSIAWALFVVIFVLTLFNWRFGKHYVNY